MKVAISPSHIKYFCFTTEQNEKKLNQITVFVIRRRMLCGGKSRSCWFDCAAFGDRRNRNGVFRSIQNQRPAIKRA